MCVFVCIRLDQTECKLTLENAEFLPSQSPDNIKFVFPKVFTIFISVCYQFFTCNKLNLIPTASSDVFEEMNQFHLVCLLSDALQCFFNIPTAFKRWFTYQSEKSVSSDKN